MLHEFDCVVVGAGHAGCEAALVAARMGRRTLLVTTNLDRVGYMPCNPSVGGPAKGHLVRELAALGGEMPYNTDRTFLQMRLLNTSKGPAVQALRAQADKALYALCMKRVLETTANLSLRQGMVVAIESEKGRVSGVQLADSARFSARAVVLTTGTFLAARIMTGEWGMPAGRFGDHPATGLSGSLTDHGLRLVRMQTNTPPRIDARGIDFSLTEPQFGSEEPLYFGLYHDREVPPPPFGEGDILAAFPIARQSAWRPQLPCYVVRTNAETHRLVRDNLHLSPIAAGISQGSGPRYCPSFEEKVVRYPDKASHLVFLEAEGYRTTEVYVQGLFTAMPVAVQEDMLHSIPALRQAAIVRPGYCVEYDVVASGQIDASLQAQGLPGLFLAGQVNGTSGYEEAAGQGWLAGVNGALYAGGREPLALRRDQSYIGVLVDDLVTKQHTEPYRLFTSRSEYRLLLRQDNADLRLSAIAHGLGLVSDRFAAAVAAKRAAIDAELLRLERTRVRPDAPAGAGGRPAAATALQMLRWPDVTYRDIERLSAPDRPLDAEARVTLEVEAKYAGYLERQEREVSRFARLERCRIPAAFDYRGVLGMRTESRERLSSVRPLTVGQAARLPGVSPADVAALLVHLERPHRDATGDEVEDAGDVAE
ncbi:MAG: tRNA uridine-5-carboxymethylaminomethyl modification enzyme MnmG/GidA [Anaerolineae bacterium]